MHADITNEATDAITHAVVPSLQHTKSHVSKNIVAKGGAEIQ